MDEDTTTTMPVVDAADTKVEEAEVTMAVAVAAEVDTPEMETTTTTTTATTTTTTIMGVIVAKIGMIAVQRVAHKCTSPETRTSNNTILATITVRVDGIDRIETRKFLKTRMDFNAMTL